MPDGAGAPTPYIRTKRIVAVRSISSSASGKLPVLVAVLVALPVAVGSASAQDDEWGERQKSESEKSLRARSVELSGTFSVRFVDPRPGSDIQPEVRYLLADDRGRETELLLEEATGLPEDLQALAGERIRVRGQGTPGDKVEVRTIEPEDPDQSMRALEAKTTSVSGSKPTATILCRFGDIPDVTPHEKSWFETLMGNSYPGIDHYWREVSYGNMDLESSQVFGWYNLPHPRSYYLGDDLHLNSGDLEKELGDDCLSAADADVFFPDFTNVNLMFNWGFANSFGEIGRIIPLDGQPTKTYGVTTNSAGVSNDYPGYENQTVTIHEMGHTFGLPHSSGMYGDLYDSEWDPMSNTGHQLKQNAQYCPNRLHPDHGCLASHTISYHKDRLGWIPPERKYTATAGSDQDITIERLGNPVLNNGDYLVAQIPIGDSPNYYTVEARRFEGYDDNVPDEAVIIHRIDESVPGGALTTRAWVVDPDDNGDPNDAGAMWTPGETFEDAANGISIEVTGESENGYEVRISTPTTVPPDTTPPNVALRLPGIDGVVGSGWRLIHARANDDRGMDYVEFLVDGEVIGTDDTAADYTAWFDTTTKTDGRATITAGAFDTAGNSTSTSRWVILNNTIPDTSITEGPEEGSTTAETSAAFEFSSTERDSTFRCKLDDEPEEECSPGKSYPDLEEGEHTFRVWADGAADGAFDFEDSDSSPATRTWTVDTVKPSGTISINGGAAKTKSKNVRLTLSARDPAPASGVSQMCISNTTSCSAWQPYASSKSWKLSGKAGTKTVYVRCKDKAGNVSNVFKDTIRYAP